MNLHPIDQEVLDKFLTRLSVPKLSFRDNDNQIIVTSAVPEDRDFIIFSIVFDKIIKIEIPSMEQMLTEFPEEFTHLDHLRTLDFGYHDFQTLPKTFKNPLTAEVSKSTVTSHGTNGSGVVIVTPAIGTPAAST